MQKRLVILFIMSCLTLGARAQNSPPSSGKDESAATLDKTDVPAEALTKADSLYSSKQYTQAFELYHQVYESGRYSSAMLLKMAHIQEGLNHLGESLFYLNVYLLASDDQQALKKMEELAKKNNLSGYETSESDKAFSWLTENYTTLAMGIASVGILLLAFMFYQQTKSHQKPFFSAIGLCLTLALLFVHINFSKKDSRGIVASAPTYLMSGPSAGSSVVGIIGEGHQLRVSGKKDVWLKVKWQDKDVYVRENLVRAIRL